MRRHGKRNTTKQKRPKTRLGLPDLDHSKSAVVESPRSRESKRGYRHAMDEFIQWYCSEPRLSFNKIVVTRFRIFLENRNLASGTINGRLAAVRRLAYEAADAGLLSPELAAGIRREKGAQEARCEAWKLAHCLRGSPILAISSFGHTQGKARPPYLLCFSAVGCDAANSPIWSSHTCSNARNTGPLSISSAKAGTFEPLPCRNG